MKHKQEIFEISYKTEILFFLKEKSKNMCYKFAMVFKFYMKIKYITEISNQKIFSLIILLN